MKKKITKNKKAIVKKESKLPVDVEQLEELIGSKELVLFFLTWLKYGRNATKAYQELHPEVTYESATVLGSKVLGKISIEAVLAAYGLDHQAYMLQLKEGMEANKQISAIVIGGEKTNREADGGTTDFIEVPDHKTRSIYHTKLGKLLGIEQESATPQVAVQVNNFIKKEKDEFGI